MATHQNNTPSPALVEIDAAVKHLYALAHRRWHPRAWLPDPDTPKDVVDALEDLRELTLELKGLWEYLRERRAHAA